MPAKNRRIKKNLNQGKSQTCEACGVVTPWFVCPVAGINPPSWYTICLDCYQENQWQTKIATRETTTKGGSSTGYKNSASQPNASPSQAHSEENTPATSSGNSDDLSWWWK